MDEINIKKLRFDYSLTQEQLGKELGLTKQQISRIESGKSALTSKNKAKILELYDNLIQCNKNLQNNICVSYCLSLPVNGNISSSYQNGIEISENKTPKYSISRKLIEDIGVNPDTTEFIICEGDSMFPSIEAGSLLMVDKSKTKISDGKIYCIRMNNIFMAKRLQFIPPFSIKVISDNTKKYDSFYINLSEKLQFDFAVIGEVKWFGTITK